MSTGEWSRSSVDYGRKLLDSGLEGAREGQEAFLQGESLLSFLGNSARKALIPAAIGACLGAVGSLSGGRQRSASRTFVFAFLGGAFGLAAGVGWESRRFTTSVACGALKSISKTRDEHWLEENPIDYA
jgi:hypothetical protein